MSRYGARHGTCQIMLLSSRLLFKPVSWYWTRPTASAIAASAQPSTGSPSKAGSQHSRRNDQVECRPTRHKNGGSILGAAFRLLQQELAVAAAHPGGPSSTAQWAWSPKVQYDVGSALVRVVVRAAQRALGDGAPLARGAEVAHAHAARQAAQQLHHAQHEEHVRLPRRHMRSYFFPTWRALCNTGRASSRSSCQANMAALARALCNAAHTDALQGARRAQNAECAPGSARSPSP